MTEQLNYCILNSWSRVIRLFFPQPFVSSAFLTVLLSSNYKHIMVWNKMTSYNKKKMNILSKILMTLFKALKMFWKFHWIFCVKKKIKKLMIIIFVKQKNSFILTFHKQVITNYCFPKCD